MKLTLTLVEWFLLDLPLMKSAAAKEKRASAIARSVARPRAARPSRSYLQTRIRGQRLLNAARILAFIELSRRLHQAYRQAYDQQAAEWLIPQDTLLHELAHTRGTEKPHCAVNPITGRPGQAGSFRLALREGRHLEPNIP